MSVSDVAAELDHVAELLSGDVVAAARACLTEARALFADASRGTARGEAEHAVALLDQALDQLDRVAGVAASARNSVTSYRAHIAGDGSSPCEHRPTRTVAQRPRVADLLARLPARGPKERKTSGYWVDAEGRQHGPLVSGRQDGYAEACEELRALGIAPAKGELWTAAHVEVKLAVRVRRAGLRDVTLVVNQRPCNQDLWSCDELLPQILAPGQRLVVHWPDGGSRTYRGKEE